MSALAPAIIESRLAEFHPSQKSMRGNPEADKPLILEIGVVEN